MAGLIGMAVLAGIKRVVCPHCKAPLARGRHVAGEITCKVCKKKFVLPKPGAGAVKRRPR